MDMKACCTCATLLSATPRFSFSSTSSSEKPLPDDRLLPCCARVICGSCIYKNHRFRFYCPYCQISSSSSSSSSSPRPSLLPQGLKDPPSYSSVLAGSTNHPSSGTVTTVAASEPLPPPYYISGHHATTSPDNTDPLPPSYDHNAGPQNDNDEKAALAAADLKQNTTTTTTQPSPQLPQPPQPPQEEYQDTLHFLNHAHDTIPSLSLRYGVPAPELRRANRLGSDHLLLARRTVLIPARYYKAGVSLSPRPVEGEEEARKAKIRRWMVATKVADYDVAVLYLEQAGYDMAKATEAYFADEQWERENPIDHHDRDSRLKGKGKGKGWRRHLPGGASASASARRFSGGQPQQGRRNSWKAAANGGGGGS